MLISRLFLTQDLSSKNSVIDAIIRSCFCILSCTQIYDNHYNWNLLISILIPSKTKHKTFKFLGSIASITGGLAGLSSQIGEIPEHWIASLAKADEIILLSQKLFKKCF